MVVYYWVNCFYFKGNKSWIIFGVNSSKGEDGRLDLKYLSYIIFCWFCDGVEVKDFDISFDVDNISMDSFLEVVILRYIEYMLLFMYNKFVSKFWFIYK